jgi:hypothetical protein
MTTKPELKSVEVLSERLVAVDVHWPAMNEAGLEQSREHSYYILRLGDDRQYRIQVALTRST